VVLRVSTDLEQSIDLMNNVDFWAPLQVNFVGVPLVGTLDLRL
jgi:hypothetical protein